MKSKLFLILVMLLVPLVGFCSVLHAMSKAAIENAFFNKTYTSIPVDNLDGKTVNNSNTIYLDGKGHVVGEMGIKPKSEPKIDAGSYKISNDGAVTIQWAHWDFKSKLCFRMYQTKNAYISISCQNVFHSVFMKSAVKFGNHITR
ncbi:MAG: hypothetical protein P1U63_07230 [Coxiellaceae bacterium]|nr:hypothetical protein [Coxiellaceae bacterium]